MFWPSSPLFHVLAVLSLLSSPADLSQMSRSVCPVPAVLSQLSCLSGPAPAAEYQHSFPQLSCPWCPVLTVRFGPSSLVCLVYADLSMMIHQADLSVHADQPGQSWPSCHIPHVLSRLCCNGCPATIVLSLLSRPVVRSQLTFPCCHVLTVLTVLSSLSSPGCAIRTAVSSCSVSAIMSQLSCSCFRVLIVLSFLFCPERPILAVLYRLSCPAYCSFLVVQSFSFMTGKKIYN